MSSKIAEQSLGLGENKITTTKINQQEQTKMNKKNNNRNSLKQFEQCEQCEQCEARGAEKKFKKLSYKEREGATSLAGIVGRNKKHFLETDGR